MLCGYSNGAQAIPLLVTQLEPKEPENGRYIDYAVMVDGPVNDAVLKDASERIPIKGYASSKSEQGKFMKGVFDRVKNNNSSTDIQLTVTGEINHENMLVESYNINKDDIPDMFIFNDEIEQ